MENTKQNLSVDVQANPGVDTKKIEQLKKFRDRLEKAGITVRKAEYRISPAIGGSFPRQESSGFVRMI